MDVSVCFYWRKFLEDETIIISLYSCVQINMNFLFLQAVTLDSNLSPLLPINGLIPISRFSPLNYKNSYTFQ